jgi:hypothetical protein
LLDGGVAVTQEPSRTFDVAFPEGTYLPPCCGAAVGITPDGQDLVFRARAESVAMYRRPLDQSTTVRLSAVDEHVGFFTLHPDGDSVLFSSAAARAGDATWHRQSLDSGDISAFCDDCSRISAPVAGADGELYASTR